MGKVLYGSQGYKHWPTNLKEAVMGRRAFAEFHKVEGTEIKTFVRGLSIRDGEATYDKILKVFEKTGAFKCRVYCAEFVEGSFGGKRRKIEIPGTRVYEERFFFHGHKLYTLDEVKEEVKSSLPILAEYLRIEMSKLGCTEAVKLRSGLFAAFRVNDVLVNIE